MAIIKIYECYDENEKEDLTFEIWSNPQYPAKFYFSDFEKTDRIEEKHQIFQWLLECASKMHSPVIAKQVVEFALKNYVTWEEMFDNEKEV